MSDSDEFTPREPSFIREAPRHLQAVLRTERALSRWASRTDFESEQYYRTNLVYRAIDKSRDGGCIADVGLFSRECSEDASLWPRELVIHHLSDGMGPNQTPKHDAHPSPYMSMLTSPEYMVKFINSRIGQKDVAIIDMDMLGIVNVEYRATRDLYRDHQFRNDRDGPTFVSEYHYVAIEHIPQCCILGFMSGRDFRALWDIKSKQIRRDPDHQGPEVLDWKNDLKDHPSLRQRCLYAQNPQFGVPAPVPTQTRTPPLTSSEERAHPAPQPETPTRSNERTQRNLQSTLTSWASPVTLNGRIQITLDAMESTTLNSARPGSRRARERSPERTISPGEDSGRDPTRRRLF